MKEALQIKHVEMEPLGKLDLRPAPDAPLAQMSEMPRYEVYRLEMSPGFYWEVWGPKIKLPVLWFRFWQRILLGWKWGKTGERKVYWDAMAKSE